VVGPQRGSWLMNNLPDGDARAFRTRFQLFALGGGEVCGDGVDGALGGMAEEVLG
jgi:hypothetical protein